MNLITYEVVAKKIDYIIIIQIYQFDSLLGRPTKSNIHIKTYIVNVPNE